MLKIASLAYFKEKKRRIGSSFLATTLRTPFPPIFIIKNKEKHKRNLNHQHGAHEQRHTFPLHEQYPSTYRSDTKVNTKATAQIAALKATVAQEDEDLRISQKSLLTDDTALTVEEVRKVDEELNNMKMGEVFGKPPVRKTE